jgi:hypothetical protein
MDGIDVDNKQLLNKPLTINLPAGNMVQSTHRCNIVIPGLPTILMGHIVPHLAIASLIGIRLLCKARCKVIFDDMKCDVIYDGKVILRGNKDPSTDLWTLPIPTGRMRTTPGESLLPRPSPCEGHAPHPPLTSSPCLFHALRQNKGQCSKIFPSIFVQSNDVHPVESHTMQLLKRVFKHQQRIDQ